MAYDPMQFAQARAGVIGRTISDIGGIAANLAIEIPKLNKIANAEKQVDVAYSEILNRFADEAEKKGLDRTTALINAKKHYLPRMNGEDPATAATRWANADTKADAFLKDLEQKAQSKQAATIAQQAVAGRQATLLPEASELTPEEKERNFSGTNAGALYKEGYAPEAPAASRREAMGRIATRQAAGEAPVFDAKAYENTPALQSLPEEADPAKIDPLLDLKKQQYELNNELIKTRTAKEKAATDKINNPNGGNAASGNDSLANLKFATKNTFEAQRQQSSIANLQKSLQQAIQKMSKGTLDTVALQEVQGELAKAGYNGPMDLDALQKQATDVAQMKVQADASYDFAKHLESEMAKRTKGALGEAWRSAQSNVTEDREQKIKGVLNALGTKYIPDVPELQKAALREANNYAMMNAVPNDIVEEALNRWKSGATAAQTKPMGTSQPYQAQMSDQEAEQEIMKRPEYSTFYRSATDEQKRQAREYVKSKGALL